MRQTGETIVRNATILMSSQLMMWLLSTAIMIAMPRWLGAANIGKLQIANALWAMISVFIAFGTETLLTKELARDSSQTSRLLGSTIVLRSLLFVVGCGVMALLVKLLGYPISTITVIGFVGIAHLIRLWIGAYYAALQGLEKMGQYSIGEIISNALYTFLGIGLLLAGWGLYAIIGAMIAAAIVNLAIQHSFLHRMHKVQLVFDHAIVRETLRAGIPYLMSSFFLVAYMQVDVIVISWFVDEQTIGWYSAADRLFGTLLFIPSVYITAAFPAFSRLSRTDTDSLKRLIAKSFDMLLLLAVPIGLGIATIANPLVVLLFGSEFEASGAVLALFGIVLIFTYQNILIGRFLISIDRQNAWTFVMAIATIATIPLDIVFIPWAADVYQNGAIGGVLSFIVTELGMLVAGLFLLPQGALKSTNAWKACRIMIAGLGMAIVTWQVQTMFIAVPILVGMTTYTALALLLRIVPKEDIDLFRHLAYRLTAKWRRPQPSALIR